jgi:hypothetical protein
MSLLSLHRMQGVNVFSHLRGEDAATTPSSETRLIVFSISHASEEKKQEEVFFDL